MEEIYRGTLADTLEYIAINVDKFCSSGDLVNAYYMSPEEVMKKNQRKNKVVCKIIER